MAGDNYLLKNLKYLQVINFIQSEIQNALSDSDDLITTTGILQDNVLTIVVCRCPPMTSVNHCSVTLLSQHFGMDSMECPNCGKQGKLLSVLSLQMTVGQSLLSSAGQFQNVVECRNFVNFIIYMNHTTMNIYYLNSSSIQCNCVL